MTSESDVRGRDLSGQVAVVTGAASGIGHATASRLASLGAAVAVGDRDADQCERVAEAIQTAFGNATLPVAFDVSSSAEVDEAFATVDKGLGRVNIVVNNAGLLHFVPGLGRRLREWERQRSVPGEGVSLGTTIRTTDELWRLHMSTMVDGVFYCTRAALRSMEPDRSGAIVNVASVGAFSSAPTAPYYAAAKAAVVAFTRSVAAEVAPIGIRVNAVAPGPTATPILGSPPKADSAFAANTASGRLGSPAEIAEVIAFLASDASSYCFGEVFTVSGGSL